MTAPLDSIYASLEALASAFPSRFEAATTEQLLRDENAKLLGKKGELTGILKQLGQVPGESRKAVGERGLGGRGSKAVQEEQGEQEERPAHGPIVLWSRRVPATESCDGRKYVEELLAARSGDRDARNDWASCNGHCHRFICLCSLLLCSSGLGNSEFAHNNKLSK